MSTAAEYCNATPIGEKWPVCCQPAGHSLETGHESADFWWQDEGPAVPKPLIPAGPPPEPPEYEGPGPLHPYMYP